MSELPARPRYAAEVMGRMRHLHFVGIGGAGMNGIAEVLVNQGFDVSGSDLQQSVATRRLASLGAKIYIGHEAGHVQDADVVAVMARSHPGEIEIDASAAVLQDIRAQ
mgnify:CR=1 FL=1